MTVASLSTQQQCSFLDGSNGSKDLPLPFPQSNAYHPPSLKLEREEIKSRVRKNEWRFGAPHSPGCLCRTMPEPGPLFLAAAPAGPRGNKGPSRRVLKGPGNCTALPVSGRHGGRPPPTAVSFCLAAGWAAAISGLLKSPLAVGLTEWIRLRLERSAAAPPGSGGPSSCHLCEWI